MAGTDEPFLGRWSRLKHEGRRRRPGPGDAPQVEDAGPAPAETQPAPGDEKTEPLDLPDIETLDKDSDYSVFMKEGVPEQLKKLALRKLWRSDPDLAVLDGLNDYDEDFRVADAILGEVAKGGDETPDDPGDDDAGAKGTAKAKDEEDEVAAATDAEEPDDVDAVGEGQDAPGADAEVAERASESADDADGKSG